MESHQGTIIVLGLNELSQWEETAMNASNTALRTLFLLNICSCVLFCVLLCINTACLLFYISYFAAANSPAEEQLSLILFCLIFSSNSLTSKWQIFIHKSTSCLHSWLMWLHMRCGRKARQFSFNRSVDVQGLSSLDFHGYLQKNMTSLQLVHHKIDQKPFTVALTKLSQIGLNILVSYQHQQEPDSTNNQIPNHLCFTVSDECAASCVRLSWVQPPSYCTCCNIQAGGCWQEATTTQLSMFHMKKWMNGCQFGNIWDW